VLACISLPYRYWITKTLKLPAEVDTIAIGDSHGQCAFDDRGASDVLNLCASAEHTLLNLLKLKAILRQNQDQIRCVVLFLSHHSCMQDYERRLLESRDISLNKAQMYWPIVPVGDLHHFNVGWNERAILVAKKAIPLEYLHTQLDFMGHYRHSNKSRPDDEDLRGVIRNHYDSCAKSELFVKSAHDIFVLCHRERIRLLVVTAPVHKEYLARIPQSAREILRETVNQPQIDHLDLSDLDLSENSYRDADHVNSRGARAATRIIFERLRAPIIPARKAPAMRKRALPIRPHATRSGGAGAARVDG